MKFKLVQKDTATVLAELKEFAPGITEFEWLNKIIPVITIGTKPVKKLSKKIEDYFFYGASHTWIPVN